MASQASQVAERIEATLWPFVAEVVDAWAVPGVAIAVVHDGDQVASHGFGVRNVDTAQPVTQDTLFHLASISKSFVATAAMRLHERGELDLHRPVTAYLPDLAWADSRAHQITVAHLLSHTSGIGDVADYGWHTPQTDEAALARFAETVAGWDLERDPGTEFSYSNAAYELLGHLLATVSGQSFEDHLTEHVLDPVGMPTSTFLRADVPAHLAATPHLGLPPRVLDDAYPYTRQHAPSSTLHSSATELGTWMVAQLAALDGTGVMSHATHATMWEPQTDIEDWGEWHQQMAHGWFWGSYREHPVVGHAGGDPGFETNLALIPELGIGAAVLINANTAPVFGLTRGALDVLMGREPELPTPPVTVGLGGALTSAGPAAAVAHYEQQAAEPVTVDLDEEAFEEAVWGAIEMHRPERVADVLQVWRTVQPDSSQAAFMTGWAHLVAGRREQGLEGLRLALALDPDNEDASTMLRRVSGDH